MKFDTLQKVRITNRQFRLRLYTKCTKIPRYSGVVTNVWTDTIQVSQNYRTTKNKSTLKEEEMILTVCDQSTDVKS